MSEMKTCTKCGETKPRTEFSKARASKDGLQFWCKACLAAYNKVYHSANAEKIADRMNEWRKANPDYDKVYYAANVEKIAARKNIYYAANAEEIVARNKAWREANPEKKAALEHRRRARLANATVEDLDIMEVWERDGHTCVYCGATESLSLDHIKPLSKGGAHSADNLCIACASCNSSKGAKPLIGWLAIRNKLDVLTQDALL